MTVKKKSPAKKSTPAPRANTYFGVIVIEDKHLPPDESHGTITAFKLLDDAVAYVQEGLEDTSSASEIQLIKAEYKIVAITELDYDIIPKQAAKIRLT